MAALSDHIDALHNFAGFPPNDDHNSISNNKKRKIKDLKTSTTSSKTMPNPSLPSEPNNTVHNPSNDPTYLVRTKSKLLSFI